MNAGVVEKAMASENFSVARATFAGGVVEREPAPKRDATKTVSPESIWFWSEIKVPVDAVEELRAQRRLPLHHKWFRNIAGTPGPDERPDFSWALDDLDNDKMERLAYEARQRGFFTYRTHSCRIRLRPGRWTVVVTDALGNRLPCRGHATCRFEIVVSTNGELPRYPCQGTR